MKLPKDLDEEENKRYLKKQYVADDLDLASIDDDDFDIDLGDIDEAIMMKKNITKSWMSTRYVLII